MEGTASNSIESQYAYIPKANATLSAGGGLEPVEGEAPERYAFMQKWLHTVTDSIGELLLMDISGDSMEPTLVDGDMVLIDKTRIHLHSDGIYAVREGDICLIKRRQRRSGKIMVISDNPNI
jgi:phage repressor protein C with HTH and peptisase S24 domain